ncbi:hypothetical protein DACRYDRAFT_108634 [Dacryopinax primogenitus]|uniref:Uncharacterized protein n=1 Tax=Dacryopinax primogenitus (strain DJM 731) TaxID=1858805 RepID=M5FXQ2_DACPD|nr:uncharacterized protein DACRYDRAFT_108634 [Dacryopinax primogenitus]EJU00565.1 hypothetical protein DACRYDRAFT_108634 [Dacryopinax primogenitus]
MFHFFPRSSSSSASSSSSSGPGNMESKSRFRLFRRRSQDDKQDPVSEDFDELSLPDPYPSFSSAPQFIDRPEIVDRPEDVQEALARLRDTPYSTSTHSLRHYPRVMLAPSALSPPLRTSFTSSSGSSWPSSSASSFTPRQGWRSYDFEGEDEEELKPPRRHWSDPGHSSHQRKRSSPSASRMSYPALSTHPSHPSRPTRVSSLSPRSRALPKPRLPAASSISSTSSTSSVFVQHQEPLDFLLPEERFALRRRHDDATLGISPWEPPVRHGPGRRGNYYFQ